MVTELWFWLVWIVVSLIPNPDVIARLPLVPVFP